MSKQNESVPNHLAKSPHRIIATGTYEENAYLIAHNDGGYRLGYVQIPNHHPWYGKSRFDIDMDVEVHGGVTHAEFSSDGTYWIGFDCAHYGDAIDDSLPTPDMPERMFPADSAFRMGTVRTIEFVREECHSLCRQIRSANSQEQI